MTEIECYIKLYGFECYDTVPHYRLQKFYAQKIIERAKFLRSKLREVYQLKWLDSITFKK